MLNSECLIMAESRPSDVSCYYLLQTPARLSVGPVGFTFRKYAKNQKKGGGPGAMPATIFLQAI
ncbi:hypothetical protein AL013_01225 [Mariprofundus ferrooxydans]|nr:hypothetical protein AL013_01225 [Mariprofundus ferrooxydans]